MTRVSALILPALLAGGSLQAQQPSGPAGWFQVDAFYHRVSNDFGDWKGFGAHLVAPVGQRDIWYADALVREAFDDQGAYASVANRHQFGDWFTLLGVGAGTGEYIHPDLRADATIGKSWGRLATLAGVTYMNAKRGFEDLAVAGSVALYFPGAAVEAGLRSNWSWPDAIQSTRGFAAITFGLERGRSITLRGGGGWEGYQLTGAMATERRFRSYEASLAWREWLGGRMGFLLQGDWYDNDFYTRTGITVGVFRHW